MRRDIRRKLQRMKALVRLMLRDAARKAWDAHAEHTREFIALHNDLSTEGAREATTEER